MYNHPVGEPLIVRHEKHVGCTTTSEAVNAAFPVYHPRKKKREILVLECFCFVHTIQKVHPLAPDTVSIQ